MSSAAITASGASSATSRGSSGPYARRNASSVAPCSDDATVAGRCAQQHGVVVEEQRVRVADGDIGDVEVVVHEGFRTFSHRRGELFDHRLWELPGSCLADVEATAKLGDPDRVEVTVLSVQVRRGRVRVVQGPVPLGQSAAE